MEESEVVELSVEDKPKSRRISSKRTSTISLAVVSSETSPATVNNSKKPPLCRGSSFTFLTPVTPWDFNLKRKRKEPKDDDTVSLSSFDLKKRKRTEKKEDEDTEPSNKRVRPLSRVSSLANLISPSKNGAVRRFGQTIQNMSLRGGDSKSPGASRKSCSKAAGPTPPKRRNSTLWSETLDAIHELSRGEQDLIEDLQMARKLAKGTGPNGTVGQIGQIVMDWLPGLNAYREYCSNQLAAKALLDQKKQDRRVQDFLQRCLESPFSRKLDLWSFLDIPRSRLVKYPLLLREILRHTPPDHPDVPCLEKAMTIIQGVLSDINVRKGESECQYYINKLEYLDDRQRDPLIDNCKTLLCHGELRNKSGSLLVLTRPVTRNERSCYQVYRQPLPIRDLALEDLQDGDVRMGGSFRGAFSQGEKAKNVFRVTSLDPTHGQSHTLQVNDVFHKQQWLNCLRSAVDAQPQKQRAPLRDQHSEATTRAKRRSSVVSMSDMVQVEEGADENDCSQVGDPIRGCKGTEALPRSDSSSKMKREWSRGQLRRRKETGV
ncbi:unnamed protein product [Coregonus sp. 'balchen']|nr:unnamed protein product [Coregonus sp. 'balchen']